MTDEKVTQREEVIKQMAAERDARAKRVVKAVEELMKAEQCAIVVQLAITPDGRVVGEPVIVAK